MRPGAFFNLDCVHAIVDSIFRRELENLGATLLKTHKGFCITGFSDALGLTQPGLVEYSLYKLMEP